MATHLHAATAFVRISYTFSRFTEVKLFDYYRKQIKLFVIKSDSSHETLIFRNPTILKIYIEK